MKLIRLAPVIILFAFYSALSQSPAAIEDEILEHLENISTHGTYSGGYDEQRLDEGNRMITETLLEAGRRPEILEYGFPKLKGQMYITTSKDGNLRIYSWDRQSGGTMHDHASVFQFRGKTGVVNTWTETRDHEEFGPFYHQLFQVDSKRGPIYLANSYFIASSSSNSQAVRVIRILGDELDRDARLIRTGSGLKNSVGFFYDFFSVASRPERPVRLIDFDGSKQEFRFPVVIEDEDTPFGRVTDKFITYRFNGSHFVKVN